MFLDRQTERLLLAAAGVLMLCACAAADQVTLKSGQQLSGTITEESDEQVVIRTMSGTVTVPRASIESVEKAGAASAPRKIEPIEIEPARAGEAFEEAKQAVKDSDWIKAGSLLEGLLKLDSTVFPHEHRLAASGALVTCYLQTRDAAGAARNFRRRANLVAEESDKKRLVAAAEALEQAGSPSVAGKSVASYEEAIEAAMQWKADAVLAKAVEMAAEATGLDDMDNVNRAVGAAGERLAEADLYKPGFADAHTGDVLKALAGNIMNAARKAVQLCTDERDELSRYWKTSAASVKHAARYNEVAGRYLARRQQAEDGIKNLKQLAADRGVDGLFDKAEADQLLAKLGDLQFHIQKPGMHDRYKIMLRKTGSATY